MASILDSFRETYSDNLGFFKILVFAIPLFYFYTQYLAGATAFANILLYVHITAFFLFGFIAETTNCVVNEEDWVMPALNPLKIAFTGIKGIIAILPSTFISVSVANFIIPYINIVPWVDYTFKTIIWLVVASIILTSFLMFAKTKNILDAFQLKTLGDKSGDFILGIIFYILQLLVMNLPTFGFIGYSIYILFGFGPVFYFFIAYAIIFNLVASAHYMAQLHYEIIGYDKQDFTPIT
jgi:hypothetical protein